MKNVLCIVACLIIVLGASGVGARDIGTSTQKIYKSEMRLEEPTLTGLPAGAGADTTWFGVWYFNAGPGCDDKGFVPVDATTQVGDFWHVDDFAGLNGGTFGGLTPIEGTQSLWLGARPTGLENLDLCGYASLPGYGNGWVQKFCTRTCLTIASDLEVVFVGRWDSEPGYDGTTLQISTCTGGVADQNWLATRPKPSPGGHYEDVSGVDSLVIEVVPDSMHAGEARLRFLFNADGGWSDEDGLWDTDGGIIIDSLSVNDSNGNILPVELFEDEAVGDTDATDWVTCNEPGFSFGNNAGNYANAFGDLFPALTMVQEDPCEKRLDCVWAYLAGSPDNYACGGFPGQVAVPRGPNSRNQYIYEEVWSPVIPYATSSTNVKIDMYMYGDLPEDNLVYFTFGVRTFVGGCPTNWRDDGGVYSHSSKAWTVQTKELGDKLEPGSTEIQVKTGIRDMCEFWCGVFGTGACHSHGPLLRRVRVYAVESVGPAMIDPFGGTFNDNFPEDGTLTGTVRIDASGDILPSASPNILNGDSLTVDAIDAVNGLTTGAFGGDTWASVYAYIGIFPQGKYSGSQIVDDTFRWPVVDSTTSPEGDKWYIVRLDTTFTQASRTGIVKNRYCLDLNDDLFVAGDTIQYFLAAQSNDGAGSWTYYFKMLHAYDNAHPLLPSSSNDIDVAFANAQEMTCLPTQHLRPVNERGDILYVDAYNDRGAQPYFDTAFQQMGILDKVDRFDIGWSGSSALGNFGSRVQDVFAQIIPVYRKVIFNTGVFKDGNVGDGTGDPIKADDFFVLYTLLDQHPNMPGVYLSGNGLASEWANKLVGSNAVAMRGQYMNFDVVTDDHGSLPGMPLSPRAIGTAGGMFDGVLGPDTIIALGGCPAIRELDVLSPTGGAVAEMIYEGNPAWGSVLSQTTANSANSTARVVLEGISFHYLRDYKVAGVPARTDHLYDIITFLQNTVQVPVSVKSNGLRNSLSQNYPNPFNPTTTIEYTLREQSPVQLKIYNVAGQLVRTLVNDVKTAGQVHIASWDGRNDAGQTVSSGVYFYKLTANNYVQTRKMVLLK